MSSSLDWGTNRLFIGLIIFQFQCFNSLKEPFLLFSLYLCPIVSPPTPRLQPTPTHTVSLSFSLIPLSLPKRYGLFDMTYFSFPSLHSKFWQLSPIHAFSVASFLGASSINHPLSPKLAFSLYLQIPPFWIEFSLTLISSQARLVTVLSFTSKFFKRGLALVSLFWEYKGHFQCLAFLIFSPSVLFSD